MARPPRGRDPARVLPGAAASCRAPFADSRRSRGIRDRPCPAPGLRRHFNETAYPFYPGPRPSLRPGQTASWFFGESPAARLRHPGVRPRGRRRARSCASGRSAPTARPAGARRAGAGGRHHRDGPHPGGRCDRARRCRCWRAIPPSGRSSRWPVAPTSSVGRCRRRWCRGPGSWPASPRATRCSPCASRQCRSSPRPPAAGGSPYRCSRAPPSPRRSGSTRPRRRRVIRSVAWDSGWKATVSVNGGPARASRSRLRPRAAGPHPGRRRPGDVPLPAAAPARWPACSASARSRPPGVARRLAGRRRRRRTRDDDAPVVPRRDRVGVPERWVPELARADVG